MKFVKCEPLTLLEGFDDPESVYAYLYPLSHVTRVDLYMDEDDVPWETQDVVWIDGEPHVCLNDKFKDSIVEF